jgi:cell division protein FtsI (penicillin-binding protein 3)
VVKPTTLVQTGTGPMTLGGWTINDSHPNGTISVAQVIQKSSNIGTRRSRCRCPPSASARSTATSASACRPPPASWRGEGPAAAWGAWEGRSSRPTMSYGHGIGVSLLQVARAYTIFTNEGTLLPLSLIKRDNQPIGKPLVSAATADQVSRMMEMAVLPGGTRRARRCRAIAWPARPAPRTSPRTAAMPSTSTCPRSWASARCPTRASSSR